MATVELRYELRRADDLVATGHLSLDQPLEIGAVMEIAGHTGTVRRIEPFLGEHVLHLIVSIDDGLPLRA